MRVLSGYDNRMIINRLQNQHTFSFEISLQTHRLKASNEAFGGSKLSEFRLNRARFCAPSYNCGAQNGSNIEPKMAHCGAQNDARWSTEWDSVALYPPKLPPHFLYFTHFRSVKFWIDFLTTYILFSAFLRRMDTKVTLKLSETLRNLVTKRHQILRDCIPDKISLYIVIAMN